jgi:hypothetical protein
MAALLWGDCTFIPADWGFIKVTDKTKSSLGARICFVCGEKQKSHQNKSMELQSAFGFI